MNGTNGRTVKIILSLCCALLVFTSPFALWAEDTVPPDPATTLPELIITEIQTGAGSGKAGEEFIELYNTTEEPLNISGWQLRSVSATASTASLQKPSFKIDIPATEPLEPHGYYVLHTAESAAEGQLYSGNLTASGSLVLLDPADTQTCERTAVDAVAWQAGQWGDGAPIASAADSLLVRFTDPNNEYVFTHDNAHDFAALGILTEATPGAPNTQLLGADAVPGMAPALTSGTVLGDSSCTLPGSVPEQPTTSPPSVPGNQTTSENNGPVVPVIPAANAGLLAVQLSEFLPNPATPQTDADDEFIELYNPNDRNFDLSGYMLEVGNTGKRRYTFPQGTLLPPRSFVAFFSADTGVSLSNSGSLVRLLDPLGNPLATADAYTTAKDGQAWILANGAWQWTTSSTPNATNVVQAPVTAAAKSAATSKNSTVKGSSTTAPKTAKPKTPAPVAVAEQPAATMADRLPVHPGVLALIGVLAILYGAYEYRHDLANKFREFRRNRAASREDR
jgi:hypothetical protein